MLKARRYRGWLRRLTRRADKAICPQRSAVFAPEHAMGTGDTAESGLRLSFSRSDQPEMSERKHGGKSVSVRLPAGGFGCHPVARPLPGLRTAAASRRRPAIKG